MIRIAWNQAVASIRVRFFRHAITALGISLAIAFFASMRLLMLSEAPAADTASRTRWLLGTSLLMCFVGVTNAMLMSVTERFREIGTLKCLGASDSLIVLVFFFEALLVGLIASAVGAVAGVAIMSLAVNFMGLPLLGANAFSSALLAAMCGLVLTLLAAVAPAVHAARMPAVNALRVEI